MSIFGIILGGTAGLIALGGPLGALLGAAAGHAVGRWRKKKTKSASGDELPAESGDQRLATRQIAFTVAAIALGAKMAKADGVVTRDEVDAFKQVFHVPQDEMQNVGRIFDQARKSSLGYDAYAEQIAGMFRRQPTVLEELLDGLFHIAKADGQVRTAEIDYLQSVATIFGFDAAKFARIRASHLGADKTDPFVVLGVAHERRMPRSRPSTASWCASNHPDRLIAKGMPKEFIDVATDKLATINSAYDRVRRSAGSPDK